MVKQLDWPELMLPIKAMRKIKLRPVGLCYLNGVERQSGTPLYRSTPSLSRFEQVNWPKLMLPIKLFQFKYVNLLLLKTHKIKLRPVGLCYVSSIDRHYRSTSTSFSI